MRRPPEPTVHYFKRKLKKFYPLHVFTYVVALVLMIAAARQAGEALDAGALAGQSIVNLLLLQSWSWSDNVIFSLNGVLWFLSSLLFCYLLAPWLARRAAPTACCPTSAGRGWCGSSRRSACRSS